MPNDERLFWMAIRQALLMFVDAIEVRLQMQRTSEIRKLLKDHKTCDTMALAE